MALLAPPPNRIKLLVLLFEGFEPLDADGPICMFSSSLVDTIIVAEKPGPVTSSTGHLTWVASTGLEEAATLAEERHAAMPSCSTDASCGPEDRQETWLLV